MWAALHLQEESTVVLPKKRKPGSSRRVSDSAKRKSSADGQISPRSKVGIELPTDYFYRITQRPDFDEILRRLAKV